MKQFDTWNSELSEYLKKDEHVAFFVMVCLYAVLGLGAVAYEVGEWFGYAIGTLAQGGL